MAGNLILLSWLQSYEKAPDWMKLALSLTSDITMAHFGPEAKAADDWFAAMVMLLLLT